MPPNNWQLDQLIGHVHEQRLLEHVLREDILQRRGQTVVITGPLGSGRAALARFALWDSLYSLPRSVEFDAVSGNVHYPPKGTLLQTTIRSTMKDIGQVAPAPFNAFLVVLACLWETAPLMERRQHVLNAVPDPQSIRKLVRAAASDAPFALHITGLDDPRLDKQWIAAICDLAQFIHNQWPVLLLLHTTSSHPLSELKEGQMTPIQQQLRVLLDKQQVAAWHLRPISVDDVRRYVHEPTDALVIRRLHELSGGWPLMVQALWKNWRSTAHTNGGGRRDAILTGDGFAEPWRFTIYGLTAIADAEDILSDLLNAYPDALKMLAVLLEDDEHPREVLRYVLSVATLEGESFTGMAVAHACGLPWEDGLEEVFDALVDAGLLIDNPQGYEEVSTPNGVQPLYRYQFTLPIWWHMFHDDPAFTDEERCGAAGKLAEALEDCYGPLAWGRVAAITALWEQAGEWE